MNMYGKAALKAVALCRNGAKKDPVQAWEIAIKEFTNSPESQKKGCPKNTFLGLCSDGFIGGIPSNGYNDPDNYERIYAQKAVEVLRNNPALADFPEKLWVDIGNGGKCHNRQMDVVCALWKNNFIKNMS